MEALEDDISNLFADNHNNNLSQKDTSIQPGDHQDSNVLQGSSISALMTNAQEKGLSQEQNHVLSDVGCNILPNTISNFLQKTKHHGRWCRFKKSVRRGLQQIRRYI